MNEDNLFVRQGWQCPICKRVYSPDTTMCYYCGGEQRANIRIDLGNFTQEQSQEYEKILDSQYKDTGLNIGDLC